MSKAEAIHWLQNDVGICLSAHLTNNGVKDKAAQKMNEFKVTDYSYRRNQLVSTRRRCVVVEWGYRRDNYRIQINRCVNELINE
jgi:hypothetical protein